MRLNHGWSRWTTLAVAFAASTAEAREVHWIRVGDLSGDGVAERVACDPSVEGGAGMVDVFDGATGVLIVRFTGDAGAQFGASAADVGDINGDGLADLLVGAPGEQRAYLIDGPFADVANPVVPSTRLAFVMEPPRGFATIGFASDVAGIHDLDGDEVPDLRVAAQVTDADGRVHSQSFVFQSITGALVGIGRRNQVSAGLEVAEGDTDRDVAVDARDMMTVVEGLGATSPNGASDGDVTLDGAVDGADVGVVLQSLGTKLYSPVAIDLGTCAQGTFEVSALGESICVEVIATSTLAAEIMTGIAHTGPIDPSQIIHPLQNDCGDKIAACLSDPRVIAAAQVVMSRCWPGGTPNTVIGRIYCSPCTDPDQARGNGFTTPYCDEAGGRGVNIILCDRSTDPCRTLAHELVHVSQACQAGLFRGMPCDEYWRMRSDPRGAICRELEAYALAQHCDEPSLLGCCEMACRSASSRWQQDLGACTNCCYQIVGERCCNGGLLLPECVGTTTGWCSAGDPHAP